MIRFDFNTYTQALIDETELKNYENQLLANESILDPNKDMMGWYKLDNLFNPELISDINNTANYIRQNCDVFIAIGVGGSYLGGAALIEALSPYFYNDTNHPKIYLVGNHFASDYYADLINLIKDKEIIINVISKSGTTLEALVGYEVLMPLMKEKYNEEELKKRIIITTNNKEGQLIEEVKNQGYKTFYITDDVGGRFSVFSPAGLLPVAVVNIDLNELYKGAKEANDKINNQVHYALIRALMYRQGKYVENYVTYEPKMYMFLEWLKQLYAETLGKENQGVLPMACLNTRDLHSLGQFIQDGHKIIFETVFNIENINHDIDVASHHKTMNKINNMAMVSTAQAHFEDGVLNNIINIERMDAYTMGYLMQFFMISCTFSSYIEGVSAFDQPGVNSYKNILNKLINEDK